VASETIPPKKRERVFYAGRAENVGVLAPIQVYIDALLHLSVQDDTLTAANQRGELVKQSA
jgi:hypothetical protein